MSVESKLSEILTIKANIKSAIVSKGVAIASNLPFTAWPGKVSEIVIADPTKGQAKLSYTATAILCEKMVLPTGATKIPDGAFRKLPIIEAVLPDGILSIGYQAFWGCKYLTKINIPTTCTTIANFALNGTAIVNLLIPSSVTAIENQGPLPSLKTMKFYANVSVYPTFTTTVLESIEFGPNVRTVSDNACSGCRNLISANLENITGVGISSFFQCSSLVNVNLQNLGSIGNYAFKECSNLEDITAFGPATIISNGAFAECVKLKKLVFPGARIVQVDTFLNCIKLETLEFNSTNTLALAGVMSNLNSLKSLVIRSNTVATAPSSGVVITGTTVNDLSLKIYVPDALVDAYKAANGWKNLNPGLFYPLSTYVPV